MMGRNGEESFLKLTLSVIKYRSKHCLPCKTPRMPRPVAIDTKLSVTCDDRILIMYFKAFILEPGLEVSKNYPKPFEDLIFAFKMNINY